jgi:putative molybdopterin biosynthesis protein
VLAAIGISHVNVWRQPIVAILSTGDEIIAPGEPMQPAKVYDSNGQVLSDAVRELGGEPRRLGIIHDDADALRAGLRHALEFADIVLLSGGTSKGEGDVSYRVVAELEDPGIVAHGVGTEAGQTHLSCGDWRPRGGRASRAFRLPRSLPSTSSSHR